MLVFMKVTFWIMKTKTKKSKLDCSLFIDNVYVFFFLLNLCHSVQSLDFFFFFLDFFFHSSESVCKGFK